MPASVTPVITTRKASSGVLPFVVHAHARGSSAQDSLGGTVADPGLALQFSWNFGDPDSTETFYNPVIGVAVNSNDGQKGPQAENVRVIEA